MLEGRAGYPASMAEFIELKGRDVGFRQFRDSCRNNGPPSTQPEAETLIVL